jgi:simple sugar transport system ATP-binding protein
MRVGKVIGTRRTSSVKESELVEMMIGKKIIDREKSQPKKGGEPVLQVSDLHVKNDLGAQVLRGVSLSVIQGEILGLAGVTGNGQQELTEIIAGLRRFDQGSVMVGSMDIRSASPLEIIEAGLSFIPADRLRMGLVGSLPVNDNLILKSYRKPPISDGFFINKDAVDRISEEMVGKYNIQVPHEMLPVSLLSGGNQQKVILAREISAPHILMIADQPTSGLDIQATSAIHQFLLDEREKGTAVLLISSDLDEIFLLSDRIAVIFEGRIMAIKDAGQADEFEIGLYMAGQTPEKMRGA